MAITAVAVDSTTTSTLTPTFNFGFTANAGDLIVFGVCVDAGVTGIGWPAGWTELQEAVPTNARAAVGYKIATGGETSVQLTGTGTADRWEGVFHRIPTGEWHGTTVPEAPAAATGSSANPDPPSVTPSWGAEAANIFIAYAARDDSVANTITAYPTNYSTAQADSNALTSAGNMGGAARINANVSPENPGTFTISASETWAAFTVAVRGAGSSPITFTPAAVPMSLTPVAPTYALSLEFAPAAVPMPLTPVAPTFALSNTFTPAAVPMPLTVVTPTFTFDWNFAPAAVPMPLTPVAPTFNKNLSLSIAAVPMPLTPVAPTFNKSLSLSIAAVPMPLTPVAPTLALSLAFAPAAVPMPLTPVAPTFVKSLTLTPAAVPMPLAVVAPTYALSLSLSPAPQPMVFGVVAPTFNSSSPSAIAFTPGVVPMELAVVAPTLLGGGLQFAGDALSTDPRVRFYWYKGLNRGNPKRR